MAGRLEPPGRPWEFLIILPLRMGHMTLGKFGIKEATTTTEYFLVSPMMTEPLGKNLVVQPLCQERTASSPRRESWWTCSTRRMSLGSMPQVLTCQPHLLLLLMYKGCWTILPRSMEEYSRHRRVCTVLIDVRFVFR